jgi:hypothetical protein
MTSTEHSCTAGRPGVSVPLRQALYWHLPAAAASALSRDPAEMYGNKRAHVGQALLLVLAWYSPRVDHNARPTWGTARG